MFPAPCPRRAFAPRILNNCRVKPLRGQVLPAENTPGNRNNGGLLIVRVLARFVVGKNLFYREADFDLELGCSTLVPRHTTPCPQRPQVSRFAARTTFVHLEGKTQRGTQVVNHTKVVKKQARTPNGPLRCQLSPKLRGCAEQDHTTQADRRARA